MYKPTIIAAAAAAALAQPALATTTFEGSATILDLHTSDPGLVLYANPLAFGPFDLEVGEYGFFDALTIGTDETAVNLADDTASFNIEIGFTFADPTGVSNTTVTGSTRGVWLFQVGIVQWNSPVTFSFGDTGSFDLWLDDTAFGTPGETTVSGKIKLVSEASPAPEPATWGMMLAGFGALGLAMRRRRNLKVSFA